MKIGILSRRKSLYSTRRLVEAATERGHEPRVVDTLRCYMDIAAHDPNVVYNGKELDFDAIIPRIGASITFYGTAVVRQFEIGGVYSLNESVAISRSRDKLRSLQLLSRKGIGLPVTAFARSPDDVDEMLRIVGGAPVVIKLLEGTQGIGVVLAETKKAAESVIEAFMGLNANIIVQEFIKEAGGSDIRCLVVGDKGRRCHEAHRQGRRVSFEPAPRRLRRARQDHAGREVDGRPGGARDGAQPGGRRSVAIESRASGNGSQLLARSGRH